MFLSLQRNQTKKDMKVNDAEEKFLAKVKI